MAALKRLVDRLRGGARPAGCGHARAARLRGRGGAFPHLFARARAAREAVYGRDVYIRGLIEFTNFCKNDCLYCGIRRSNARACRYRLSRRKFLPAPRRATAWAFARWCCRAGRMRIFTDERLCRIVRALKAARPEPRSDRSPWANGAGRATRSCSTRGPTATFLRHETATKAPLRGVAPAGNVFENRMRCLADLKAIGYQVGCGFMVGSPWQTPADIARDPRLHPPLRAGDGGHRPLHPPPRHARWALTRRARWR